MVEIHEESHVPPPSSPPPQPGSIAMGNSKGKLNEEQASKVGHNHMGVA